MIIQNSNGEVMVGMVAKGEYVHNSDDVEALACRKSLKFAIETGFQNMLIEGNYSNVMRAILSTIPNSSFFGHIVDDIRHFFGAGNLLVLVVLKGKETWWLIL